MIRGMRNWLAHSYGEVDSEILWATANNDIPMLKENFNVHGIPFDWLDRVYDLQRIFNVQTDGASKQRSLEYAMEYFEIPQNLPAHDALNDAYFTALVAMKLDVPEGVRKYSEQRGEFLSESVIGDADAGDDGYVTIGELLDDDIVKNPLCPICNSPLESLGRTLHSKGQKYTLPYTCKTDGEMFLILRLHRNFNDTWRAKRVIRMADEKELLEYRESLERASVRRKARKRKAGPRRRTVAGTTSEN